MSLLDLPVLAGQVYAAHGREMGGHFHSGLSFIYMIRYLLQVGGGDLACAGGRVVSPSVSGVEVSWPAQGTSWVPLAGPPGDGTNHLDWPPHSLGA